jgi:hypothetical protein
VEVVKALLRFVSYVFHGLFALALLALSGLSLAAGAESLHLGMLPWTGTTLLYVLLCGSLVGLLTLFLALRGSMGWLFFLWSLVVAVMLVKGYFLSSYRFSPGEADTALYLLGSSAVALVGSWFVMTRTRRPAR